MTRQTTALAMAAMLAACSQQQDGNSGNAAGPVDMSMLPQDSVAAAEQCFFAAAQAAKKAHPATPITDAEFLRAMYFSMTSVRLQGGATLPTAQQYGAFYSDPARLAKYKSNDVSASLPACYARFPRAKPGLPATLPADLADRALICTMASSVVVESTKDGSIADTGLVTRAKLIAGSLKDNQAVMLTIGRKVEAMSDEQKAMLQQQYISDALDIGTMAAIVTTCPTQWSGG